MRSHGGSGKNVVKCDVPTASVLDRSVVERAYFQDSYRAPLSHPRASVTDIFYAIFAHRPAWMNAVLIIRNKIASWCGLDAPAAAEILNVEIKDHFAIGDMIGPWPIFALSANELVAGRDNAHLDFRLSILKTIEGESANVVVTTICTVHNMFGKIYLFFIIPFHIWGVQRLITNAVNAGRL